MKLFAPFNSDGYKLGHELMYSEGTTRVYSNLTPRSDRIYSNNSTRFADNMLVFAGAQGALREMVESWDDFFATDMGIAVGRFKLLVDHYLGPDVVPTDSLIKLHKLGYLPLRIKTLDEGKKVKMGVPVLTITNTVDHAFWLVNFLETTISNLTWKTSTTATIAAEYKRMLLEYARITGVDEAGVLFQAHDFSARGMSGPEDAARSGVGHLCSFLGTDTLASIPYVQDYYGAGNFVAASVPATEHAVATSNILRIEKQLESRMYDFPGNKEQVDIYNEMMDSGEDIRLIAEIMFLYELMLKFPKGILSYVADSFDFWSLIEKGLPYIKHVILRRESNGITPGKLVIRPDSARYSPTEVICGVRMDQWTPDMTQAEFNGAVLSLYEIFGGTTTAKGYKELDSHIGVIYGDSITPSRCLSILEGLEARGFASSNCVFGVGSYTYQCNTRDTFGFAVKATHTVVNGEEIDIFKDPKTDSKKKSATGRLQVNYVDGILCLEDKVSAEEEATGELKIRFEDGAFYNLTSLEAIRNELKEG